MHPAFENKSNMNPKYKNGGWNSELIGIWGAKYETSKGTEIESFN